MEQVQLSKVRGKWCIMYIVDNQIMAATANARNSDGSALPSHISIIPDKEVKATEDIYAYIKQRYPNADLREIEAL